MTSYISRIVDHFFPKTEYRCIFLGLESSGKTTILYKMLKGFDQIIETIPTIGFNVERFELSKAKILMWDVGGCDKIRPLLRHYYNDVKGLVFVIDAMNCNTISESRMKAADDAYLVSRATITETTSEEDAGSSDIEFIIRNRGEVQWHHTVEGVFSVMLNEDELRDCRILIFLNKQDLVMKSNDSIPPSEQGSFLTVEDLIRELNIEKYVRNREIFIQPCSASTGEGLQEGFDWLAQAMEKMVYKGSLVVASTSSTTSKPKALLDSHKLTLTTVEEKNLIVLSKQDEILQSWLLREDESDDTFLSKLSDYSLDSWDHYTHLRIAWLILTRYGYDEGVPEIFSLIKDFIANSQRTKTAPNGRGTTFHETMTYFWVHMVYYKIVMMANNSSSASLGLNFKDFLKANPELTDGGLFLQYYSKELMLLDPNSRKQVLLPDIQSLPSVIPKSSRIDGNSVTKVDDVKLPTGLLRLSDISDQTFYQLAMSMKLPSWGHDIKLRLIYVMLLVHGHQKYKRESAVKEGEEEVGDQVLSLLKRIENNGFHLTLNAFWVHMLSYHILLSISRREYVQSFGMMGSDNSTSNNESPSKWNNDNILIDTVPFSLFMDKYGDDLNDSMLYLQYFSEQSLVDREVLHFPDLKSFPSASFIVT